MEVIRKHDLKLASDFFFRFARFEYALKAAGFHFGKGNAKPNWSKFSKVEKSGSDLRY